MAPIGKAYDARPVPGAARSANVQGPRKMADVSFMVAAAQVHGPRRVKHV